MFTVLVLEKAEILDERVVPKLLHTVKQEPVVMSELDYAFRELPTHRVEVDPDQPRKEFGTDGDKNRLLVSVREYGIQQPVIVSEVEPDRYVLMDGHRRYKCALELGWESVPARVYPRMSVAEFETRRFEMQNNRRPWSPLERAGSLDRIKGAMEFKSNRELSRYLGVTETAVSTTLQLRKIKVDYIELIYRHKLSEAFQKEFVRLKPKLRKIRTFETPEIIENLFDRVSRRVIRNSKDFRTIGSVFLRSSINEEALYDFLRNPDMTVGELQKRTTQSGLAWHIDELIQHVAAKRQQGVEFSTEERMVLGRLTEILNQAVI